MRCSSTVPAYASTRITTRARDGTVLSTRERGAALPLDSTEKKQVDGDAAKKRKRNKTKEKKARAMADAKTPVPPVHVSIRAHGRGPVYFVVPRCAGGRGLLPRHGVARHGTQLEQYTRRSARLPTGPAPDPPVEYHLGPLGHRILVGNGWLWFLKWFLGYKYRLPLSSSVPVAPTLSPDWTTFSTSSIRTGRFIVPVPIHWVSTFPGIVEPRLGDSATRRPARGYYNYGVAAATAHHALARPADLLTRSTTSAPTCTRVLQLRRWRQQQLIRH